jgi:hypothetical protein
MTRKFELEREKYLLYEKTHGEMMYSWRKGTGNENLRQNSYI